MHDATLPPRIWVVGPPGSGKSTLATRLAERLGIEPTFMDEIHWRPGWIEASPEEDRAAVAKVMRRPSWVVDGNYSEFRRPYHDLVQLFVWLDLPLTVTFPRLLKRGLQRSLLGQTCCNGNRESLYRTFFHKDSLLLYALQMHNHRQRSLEADLRERPHVRLRTPQAVHRWLRGVSGAARSPRS